MKFGKQLAAQQIPAWSAYYVDYKGLKKIINSLAKGRPADAALLAAGYRPPFHLNTSSHIDNETASELSAAANLSGQSNGPSLLPESGESALLQAHKAAFFFKLERELEKINAFYLQKEAEMKDRMRALIDKRKMVQGHLAGKLSRDSASFIALHEGLRYFERDLSKLQNYIEMNATGFRKILKKWDKRSKSTTKELYLARQVDVQPCFNREVVSELSDTAAANVRKLENLCMAKGGEQTVDPAADGILSERKGELALANAQAQDDLLSNFENELMGAIGNRDREAIEAILSGVPSFDLLSGEVQSHLARILWRGANAEADTMNDRLISVDKLDFAYIDDINGRTPLIKASARGNLALVSLCVENGVNIGHRDAYGREALHYAAMISSDVVAFLLNQGADASVVDLDGASAMTQAINAGRLECVQRLLEASSATQTAGSVLPLALAAKLGHTAIVSLLLEKGHAIAPDASGFLPHHIAAREGHQAVLELLLNAGASIDAPDKFANWTPLFHAANEGHIDCVVALLKAGASVTAKDDQSKTAIHHAAWSGHPEIVSALLQAKPSDPPRVRAKPAEPVSLRKRTAADVAASDMDLDLDSDLIPDLSLPPPALPLRTYGHSYLDGKRSLVQLSLGHLATSSKATPPVSFNSLDQPASLKLVITSQQDSFNVPHTLVLPLADEREGISLLVDSLEALTLQIEVYPTFGTRLIGKAVCLPATFSKVRSIEAFTAPILDTHLNTIGEVNFEVSFVSQFQDVQLAIGGRLETYWKSTTTEAPVKRNGPAKGTAQDQTYITASSLSAEYTKVVVQLTKDGVPFVYPKWLLPEDDFALLFMERTSSEMQRMADRKKQSLRHAQLPAGDTAMEWYQTLSEVIAPLVDVFSTIPDSLGLNIEVRYPTPSDAARIGMRDSPELNAYIDSLLSVVYANTLCKNGTPRRIFFSSFSPAACAVLNWKQPNYAVLFASYCGLSRSTPEGQLQRPNRTELDRRCTSIEGAVKFARANNLLGVLLDATIVSQVPTLVDSIKENGLLLALFGVSAPKDPSLADVCESANGVLTARAVGA